MGTTHDGGSTAGHDQQAEEAALAAAVDATEQGLLFDDDVSTLDRYLGYRGPTACNAAGITYRQLDYWARTNLIRPSLSDASGSGSRRRYSYKDLLELRVIKTLLDAGQKLERVRAAFEYLRDLGDYLTSSQLVIAGDAVVLVRDGEDLVDVLAAAGPGRLAALLAGGRSAHGSLLWGV